MPVEQQEEQHVLTREAFTALAMIRAVAGRDCAHAIWRHADELSIAEGCIITDVRHVTRVLVEWEQREERMRDAG